MASNIPGKYFPSQVVSDVEKVSYDYGLKVAKAIEHEWFGDNQSTRGGSYGMQGHNQRNFHNLRLYARGEQSIQKYKDELSINGDLSYLNLDWKPVPIISKFVDIVVNGMADKAYDLKAYSQDPFGVQKRTEYMESLLRDMKTKDLNDFVGQSFGINLYENDPETLPKSEEELKLHMQLTYKQAVELAEEQALNVLFEGNKYDLIKKRFYTESPYFDDIYYAGEIKEIPVNELAKQFPHLTQEDLEEIQKKNTYKYENYSAYDQKDNNKIKVLYFDYKTYMNQVYKIKETATGLERAIEKDDNFNPPEDANANFSKLQNNVECLYEGAYIIGAQKLLKWEMSKNMMRPKSNYTKVKMNYNIVAPRMYKGRIESLVSRITGFADMIQLTHLKIQQVMSRMVPDGVYLDADGLAEIDLGNGTNYNPQEALNMFFQTGSVIGRSMTQDGDINPGKVPIQEIRSSSGGNKLQALIGNYNYYMQMIRDTTGLNEARDGSTPDSNALVGVQKLAAANSNTATRHILQSGLYLTSEVAECLSLRISDVIEYSPTKDAFIHAIGAHNVATLEEISNLHLYDFGIFLELAPDEEEKALLENNIQQALQQKNIDLEDAIDLREIRNVSLANQLLKIRRKEKEAKDREIQQQNIQMQTQANTQAAQNAAQLETQKEQMLAQTKAQLAQLQVQLDTQKLQQEAEIKKELMQLEFQMNMQLKSLETQGMQNREKEKEDRKDERTRIQASQQSELIDQRKTSKPPKKFESSGNDVLGGFDLGGFEPR